MLCFSFFLFFLYILFQASGGAATKLRVLYQPNRCAVLESARVPGHTVIFDHHGIAGESAVGYADFSKEFVIFVKVKFILLNLLTFILLNTYFLLPC